MQENNWASHFLIPNLVIQIDRSFQQFTSSIYQNNPSELLFIALVFHIEMYLSGLQVFLKVLIQVAFIVKNNLFLREGSAGFPNFGKKKKKKNLNSSNNFISHCNFFTFRTSRISINK